MRGRRAMLEKTEPMGGIDPEELAAEFLARAAAGETAEEAVFLARLPDDAARSQFRALVVGAGLAERGLPRAIVGGTRLAGRYRILEPIGAGGMGKVFSAVDESLGRTVAIKLLEPLAQGNHDREELFRKESRLLADLKHPGIVAVHDAGRDGPYAYIAMDLVDGTALSQVLDRARSQLVLDSRGDRLPPRDGRLLAAAIGKGVPPGREDRIEPGDWYRSCARILLDIARTIEAAHGKKVVHRDLKPANVMLQGGGNPVVLDFGLAGSPDLPPGGVTQALYGSVCYLAPEQARSQRIGMDPRTDVYQIGLILYEMLTLRRAFPGTAIGEVLQRIQAGTFELPHEVDPRVPRDLEAICTMALELSPERRYASARELREDLERWLDGRAPVAARSARWRSLLRTTRSTGRRHPVLAGTAAVALALGAGALAWSGTPDTAPSIRGCLFNIPLKRTEVLSTAGTEIRRGEWLGVNVANAQETWLYALSVFGNDEEELKILPYRPRFPSEADDEREGDPWGRRVPPAPTSRGWDLVCTEITETSPDGAIEGLIVYASPEPLPQVERWMSVIGADRQRYAPSVTEAYRMLGAQMTTLRGLEDGQPRPRSEEWLKSAQEFQRFRGAEGKLPEVDLPGTERVAVECRVAAD